MPAVAIRLAAPELDFWVDVRVVTHFGRWLAVAIIGGDLEIGTGGSCDAAIAEALASLGQCATHALLAAEPRRTRESST